MNPNVSNLLDIFISNQLSPRITLPARVTHTSSTLIDHVYKKVSSQKSLTGTLINDITDHYINFVFTSVPKRELEMHKYISYR